MFGVPKYSAALEKLRKERDVDGLFSHNLVKVDAKARKATFAKPDGTTVVENFDLLHVVPPQSPPDFIRTSSLGELHARTVCFSAQLVIDGESYCTQLTAQGGSQWIRQRLSTPNTPISSRSVTRLVCRTPRLQPPLLPKPLFWWTICEQSWTARRSSPLATTVTPLGKVKQDFTR